MADSNAAKGSSRASGAGSSTYRPNGPGEEFGLKDAWNTFARNRWLIAGITLSVLALAALVTWLQAPKYESTVSLRIDEEKSAAGMLLKDFPMMSGMNRGQIETEMAVLQSRQIAAGVVDSLALHVRLLEPKRSRGSLFSQVHAPRDAEPAKLRLRYRGDGVYDAELTPESGTQSIVTTVRIGEAARVSDVSLTLNPALHSNPPDRIRLELRAHDRTVEDLQRAVSIARPNRDAQIIRIRYRDTDPHLAAEVPNAVADRFLQYKWRTARTQSQSTIRFLHDQVNAYEAQLLDAEEHLRDFRERHQVVSLTAEASEQIKRLAELQARRDELRTEQQSLARLLAGIENRGADGSPARLLASFPTFLANRGMHDLLLSLTELENRRAELAVRRTESNLDIQGIDRRIAALEAQLHQTALGYLGSIETQLATIDANLARFGSRLETVPAREIEFARYARQQELLADIYTLLQTRLKEAEIQNAIELTEVQILDAALIATRPVTPRPTRNLGLGLVLGLMLGIGTAFARQTLDTKVRSTEDAETATSGMPILGVVPRFRPGTAAHTNGNGNGNGVTVNRLRFPWVARVTPTDFLEERLVALHAARSPAAEAYRALRTNITFSRIDRAPQVLVVTSALPGDGKSTTSSNLAITLAQQGARTLLIDADLRKGILHRVFGLDRHEPGLTHVLLGRADLKEAVQRIDVGNEDIHLDMLCSGLFPPNPAELLGSERTSELLGRLRESYDAIVIDAPPLAAVTDAALLGAFADATILVTRFGVTDKGALQFAANQLHRVRAPIGGVVLNDFDFQAAGYGNSYGYYGEYEHSQG
jgi:polysaccharide biosynthesis transport protein